MASKRTSTAPSSLSKTSTDTESSKNGSNPNKANNTGIGKKGVKSSGTFVKSRYMQSAAAKTALSKSNSLTNDSIVVPPRPSSHKPGGVKPRVGIPPRRSMAPSKMSHEPEPSLLGESIMQSTFSDGHCFQPNFDISVIKAELERNPETDKSFIERQTFLLAYVTAKMESNTAKAKAEAEARLMQEMEEEEVLYNEVQEMKRQHLLLEKNKTMHELLNLQIAALTPVAETAKQFTKDYKSFATAVDHTRHELPVKNFYTQGDRREFLGKAESCLKESEKLLLECTEGDHKDNSTCLECIRDIKTTSKAISQQVSSTLSELLELSSLVGRHSIHDQQATEEEQLGAARTHQLFCQKQ